MVLPLFCPSLFQFSYRAATIREKHIIFLFIVREKSGNFSHVREILHPYPKSMLSQEIFILASHKVWKRDSLSAKARIIFKGVDFGFIANFVFGSQ